MLLTELAIEPISKRRIPCGYLRVEQGRITGIGPMRSLPEPKEGEALLPFPGLTAYPGFIDAHSHIGLFGDGQGAEGEDGNEMTDPLTPHLRALDGVNPYDRCFAEAAAAGITTVVVSPGSANPIAGQICALKTAGGFLEERVVAEPLAMKLALGENPKSVYGPRSQSPATRMATAALIRDALRRAKRYGEDLRRAAEDDEVDEPEQDSRLEALLPVLSGELPVHIHAHRADDIATALRLMREFSLRGLIIHGTEAQLLCEPLQRAGVGVIVGPMVGGRVKPELVNLSAATAGVLQRAGVRVAISTDHPEVNEELLPLSAALAIRAGMAPEAALAAITLEAARLIGLEKRVGSLEKGKDADIVLFDADPLSLYAKPVAVFIRGERIV